MRCSWKYVGNLFFLILQFLINWKSRALWLFTLNESTIVYQTDWYKVPTKSLESFGNHYILKSYLFLLYNATLFITIASRRVEILPLSGRDVREEMCQIGTQQNNPQWYWLKLSSRMSYWFGWMVVFLAFCLVGRRFGLAVLIKDWKIGSAVWMHLVI